MQYKSRSRTVFVIFNTIFLVLLASTMIVPLLNTIALSFSTDFNSLRNTMTLFPNPFSIQGYKTLLSELKLDTALINTLYITIVGTLIHIFVCATTAYALARYDFPGKKTFFALVMVTLMIPFQNVMIPTYLLYKKLHLINTYTGLLLVGVVSGFTIMLLRNFFEDIPRSICESAIIEGANEWQLIYKIFLPLAKPGLTTVSIFTIITKWNLFMEPLILISSPKKQMLQVVIRNLVTLSDVQTTSVFYANNVRMAAIVVSIAPLITMFIFAQKYFVKGITLGSTKG